MLAANLRHVELVSQIRSSRDYEITDLDHYYEFYGGLTRSVEQASGRRAMLLISDTQQGHARTESVDRAIQRGVRTRLLNPKWLDAMLGHAHHGGQQIASRVENLLGLAATTGAVSKPIFDEVSARLVLDDALRARLQQNNAYALMDVVERLLEAHRRGYWEPDSERIERMERTYLELEGHLESSQLPADSHL